MRWVPWLLIVLWAGVLLARYREQLTVGGERAAEGVGVVAGALLALLLPASVVLGLLTLIGRWWGHPPSAVVLTVIGLVVVTLTALASRQARAAERARRQPGEGGLSDPPPTVPPRAE